MKIDAKALNKALKDTFGSLTHKQIMALTIYGEARGESREGRIAVGSVILERLRRGGWFGKSLRDVCLRPWQFSCFLPNDPNFLTLKTIAADFVGACKRDTALRDCFDVADGLMVGTILPNVDATHYVTVETTAPWASDMKQVAVIGGHKFFT
jgi:hypothetical protein